MSDLASKTGQKDMWLDPLDAKLLSEGFLGRVPHEFARAHGVVSQGVEGGVEQLVASPDCNHYVCKNIGVALGREVVTYAGDSESIARTLDEAYEGARRSGPREEPVHEELEDLEFLLAASGHDILSTQGKSRVVKLVDSLLFEALGKGASDVHVQPLVSHTLVRYRIDGVLHTACELSRSATAAVVSRIKVMGGMDIAERRMAQDGRAKVTIGDRSIDLRISSFPTSYGERVVLRLLDTTKQLLDLDSLGMPEEVQERYLEAARQSHGLILLTGPTGSGKTTSLYATLMRIARPEINIVTVEDPIEYELSTAGFSISQSQVNRKKGATFATGLRYILRQDPDVILVGEIRDEETARMAIQSSLTGHLVLSTLHTNDAPSAVTRLIDLGVEPYLVSASLLAVVAQRLVRRRHLECEGQGCEGCVGSGFKGRMGVYELMVVDEVIQRQISQGAGVSSIKELAVKGGMRTLQAEGARLVREGLTSQSEVARAIQAIS